ncbi:MAG: flagellar basal body P-ring formation protein FlgA [Alphaproteobacteria bacterium]|nr:flagellar basal body P-ring formation protein FlgA [Alphaproteobacteria bacterium]
MKRLIPIIVFLAATAIAQAALGQVRLRAQATTENDVITLGDLFTGVESLAGEEVGPAPAPGRRATYKAEHLIAIARAHGLKWSPASSVSRAVVSRGGEIVDEAEITELLRREFRQKGAVGRVIIRLNKLRDGMLRPLDGGALRIEDLTNNSDGGPFSAYIESDGSNGVAQRQLLRGRVDFVARVPVASRAIRKGEKITAGDVKWMELSQRLVGSDAVEHMEQLVGLAAKRNLRLNQPIKQSNLRTPIMIAKGTMVTITLKSGGISLSGAGRALEDGSLGENIQIMNIKSKRKLGASVIGPDRVRVALLRQIAVTAAR